MKKKKFWKNSILPSFFTSRGVDYPLIFTTLALLALGLLMVFSATKSYNSPSYIKKQAIASLLGLVLMIGLMLVDYRIWKKYYLLLYGASIALLVATLVFGHGESTWGAKSWLKIGPINFQPAEFVKLWLIISLATWLEDHGQSLNTLKTLLKTLAFAGLPVFLIMLQPDFGTAMVFLAFIAVMLFFANIHWKYILSALGAALVSLPFLYLSLDTYQKDRILDFLKPEENISGSGYQAYEGRIAIGNGRFFGRGFLKGTQTQFNFIPTKETDYIFPVLVEELGFLGGSILILLYLILIFRLLKISSISKDKAGSYMIIGFVTIFLVHIWENIGMTLGLMPLTGIPLPFISYGGSFQLVNLASIGLALSVRYHRIKKDSRKSHPIEEWLGKKYHGIADYYDEKLKREYQKRKKRPRSL